MNKKNLNKLAELIELKDDIYIKKLDINNPYNDVIDGLSQRTLNIWGLLIDQLQKFGEEGMVATWQKVLDELQDEKNAKTISALYPGANDELIDWLSDSPEALSLLDKTLKEIRPTNVMALLTGAVNKELSLHLNTLIKIINN